LHKNSRIKSDNDLISASLEKAADEIEYTGKQVSHGQQDEYGPEDDAQNVAYDE
jgi:hypothetical protein